MRPLLLAGVLSIAIGAAPAFADTVVVSELTAPDGGHHPSQMYVGADRLRIETPDSLVIFRADQNTAYMARPADKAYIRMTTETLKASAAMMEQARAELAKQLKSMPADQRAQMEKMMGGAMPDPDAKLEYRKTGKTAQFGKWTCDLLDQSMNGQLQATLCVARLADLGLSPGDMDVLQRFAAFMAQGTPQAARAASAPDPREIERAVGYPAFSVHTEVPQAKVATTVQSVEKKAVPAAMFEMPAGFREEPLPNMR